MNDDTFDFDGIFDHLTPDDFAVTTTAVSEVSQSGRGVDQFNLFVDEQIRALRTAYLASEGQLNPLTIIASPSVQRMFTPTDEETLGEFVGRCHAEARTIGATWVFLYKKTYVASLLPKEEGEDYSEKVEIDPNADAEELQRLVDGGHLHMGVMWYAERREGDERHHRHGNIAEIDGQLGKPTEGSPLQPVPLFSSILGLP